MHTFHHEETGVTIHHNSDNSGMAVVTVPDILTQNGTWTVDIPAAALAAFGYQAAIRDAIRALEDL